MSLMETVLLLVSFMETVLLLVSFMETVLLLADGGSVVVTLNLGSVRTRGRSKGQDRINRFAKKRKLATNSVVGESAVVDSCVLCGLCGDIELARE
ncbi:hypothetical protein PoB_001185100 [Plakobranchus ocellatus]|uniref:Secreted protein n=1 Tax=Plakobranchus ocellatus TaxID=259542 RepID=A0AAV3YSG4_9GAST|nr:hypothetical protein PoB_001185100 [Plakobranchus ocellatus]